MMLWHAIKLAPEQIYQSSKPEAKVSKIGPFTDEHLKLEDWEPFYPPVVAATPTLADCGCGPESAKKK